jgi:ribose transport system permease protein
MAGAPNSSPEEPPAPRGLQHLLLTMRPLAKRLASEYGIVAALAALCVYFSWVTYGEQRPTGASGGAALAAQIKKTMPAGATVLVAARDSREDSEFAEALRAALDKNGYRVAAVVKGQPSDAREALEKLAGSGSPLNAVAASQTAATWAVFDDLPGRFPSFAGARVIPPPAFRGANFLKTENLFNIANQIAVIALIAIGMTLVIITGGIDLSVGSLIAFSAVVSALSIRDYGGAERAGAGAMFAGAVAGVGACALVGMANGVTITLFRIPPFIVTLGMMLVASGLAFIFAKGQSVYQLPDAFTTLGRGTLSGLPIAVLLMLLLYACAHVMLTRTRIGRHIYAVGSNRQAARLSGIPVNRVLVFVYTISGALAGLGGVVMASQLKSGAPTYGQMYELYVIAAVVVGGASLSGGKGTVIGTLIGALIIAVIQNGMNLTNVESYTQKVVLGLVILGAVLLDRVRKGASAEE